MKEQFVTYEIALKLKELGFDEQCFGLYKNEILYRDYETFQWNEFSNCIKAPLWQQVIDWIRKKYNIYIYIMQYEMKWYQFFINMNDKTKDSYLDFHLPYFNLYYDACESAILKSIELININNGNY